MENLHFPSTSLRTPAKTKLHESSGITYISRDPNVKHSTRVRRTQTRFHSRMSWMAKEREKPWADIVDPCLAASETLAGFFVMNEFTRRALPLTCVFRHLLSPHVIFIGLFSRPNPPLDGTFLFPLSTPIQISSTRFAGNNRTSLKSCFHL